MQVITESKNDWNKLAGKLEKTNGKYVKDLAEIKSLLGAYKPKPFWKTQGFVLAVLSVLFIGSIFAWSVKSGQCITYSSQEYGFCKQSE